MAKLKNAQRPIDKIALQHYSWWGRSFVFIKKAQVKTWQAIFIIAFVSGICATLIWTISENYHPYSSAAVRPSTITVSTPNGGETYSTDSAIIATVISNYTIKSLSISLFNQAGTSVYRLQNTSPIQAGSSNVGLSLPELKKAGYNIVPGKYKITACDERANDPNNPSKMLCDSSDSYFTITAFASMKQPIQ